MGWDASRLFADEANIASAPGLCNGEPTVPDGVGEQGHFRVVYKVLETS